MPRLSFAFGLSCALLGVSFEQAALAAPAPPRGPHPRIYLSRSVTEAMKAASSDANSGAGRSIAQCKDAIAKPSKYATNDAWQWSFGVASCALAYRLTGDGAMAQQALVFMNALLDDYNTIGDGAGGNDVVAHDAGYEIRTHAYAALAYDWLDGAPGFDDTLKAHARERFKAWVGWYDQNGYLNDTPGSNYHAGYVFAKTLVAIATGGEDDGSADQYWSDAVDKLYGKQIVGAGLAKGGALAGGDWPEGWQYGSLSVLEYALGARAIEEHGGSLPDMHAWASDLALAYLYAIPPGGGGVFTDGDLDNNQPTSTLNGRPLLASMAGLGSDQAASYAAQLVPQAEKSLHEDCPVFDALAETRGAKPVDFTTTNAPLWYVAKGTRKLFARSSWKSDATFAYFTAAPRLVPDHQHNDASSFVLVRGSDWLIADPSPYGSLSTLTGNALDVDSKSIDSQAKPSQSIWENQSSLVWAKGVASGIAAARADLSGAFDGVNGKASDVPFARRDWAYLPEGDVVVIDRARTDDPSRAMHVRFRSPIANLKLSSSAPWVANGATSSAALFIQASTLSGGTPALRDVGGGGTCDNTAYGQCTAARFAVSEYSVDLPGPAMHAVHVIDGLGASDQAPRVLAMDSVDARGSASNDAVIGAVLLRGGTTTAVVASSARDGNAGASLSYTVPGDTATRHVVFDAPEDANGESTITTQAANGHCTVTIAAGKGFSGHPLVFSLAAASGACSANEDKPTDPGAVQGGGGGGAGGGSSANADSSGGSGSGCGCRAANAPGSGAWAALTLGALAFARRRRRAPPGA